MGNESSSIGFGDCAQCFGSRKSVESKRAQDYSQDAIVSNDNLPTEDRQLDKWTPMSNTHIKVFFKQLDLIEGELFDVDDLRSCLKELEGWSSDYTWRKNGDLVELLTFYSPIPPNSDF